MTEGSAVLMAMIYSLRADGRWRDERGVNLLDSGSHYYDTYETADGKFISIGALEPQFYRLLLERLGLADDPDFLARNDESRGRELKARLDDIFRMRTRDDWCALLEGTDACFAPVLSLDEAPYHPHNVERRAFVDVEGAMQPAPAPRYSQTRTDDPRPMRTGVDGLAAILREVGYGPHELAELQARKVVA
jgi:alpha-methylacyl-CoA racemase